MTWSILIPYKLESKTGEVIGIDGKTVRTIDLPIIFSLPIRRDLIRRAYLSAFTAMLQPKGRDPMAGRRTTARSFGVGRGIARVPRLPNGRAAFVVFARGGHAAFPPRPDEKLHERINKREKALATASAIAATSVPEIVRARGHVFSRDKLPIIIDDDVEKDIKTAKEARVFLKTIGVWQDIERSYERIRIRAGRGKMRGRKYVEPRSILFVLTSYDVPLARAVRNFPGVDIATPNNLGILHLAPGGEPGRLTVYSLSALQDIATKYEVKLL